MVDYDTHESLITNNGENMITANLQACGTIGNCGKGTGQVQKKEVSSRKDQNADTRTVPERKDTSISVGDKVSTHAIAKQTFWAI